MSPPTLDDAPAAALERLAEKRFEAAVASLHWEQERKPRLLFAAVLVVTATTQAVALAATLAAGPPTSWVAGPPLVALVAAGLLAAAVGGVTAAAALGLAFMHRRSLSGAWIAAMVVPWLTFCGLVAFGLFVYWHG